MTITNHWGVTVDSEKPTTGVCNSNAIAWEWVTDEICLDCSRVSEAHGDSEEYNDECEYCRDNGAYCLEWIECDGSHTKIIGDWVRGEDGLYAPDEAGEFAAIVNEVYTQVVFSKVVKECALCSPCYPGQGDLDTPGEYKSYELPDWLARGP